MGSRGSPRSFLAPGSFRWVTWFTSRAPFPEFLGIILMVECFAWLMFPVQFFFFPGNVVLTYVSSVAGFIGEFSLTLWLLIMGAREQK